MSDRKDVPVYLFTGFLESGKTKFIQETLEDKRFCNGERTMLLVCEEGEEEYAPDQFADKSVYIHVIEDQSELTAENLEKWLRESRAERVVVEYNGMWMLDVLYSAMPESWMVYQEFMFADAGTFLTYNNNMRQLVYDKLKSCELVVFNRFKPNMDKMEFHKIVRGASRRSDIAYEYAGGKVEYDDIEDPLPFDLTAPVVEIGDDDYAVWYRDLSEEPKKYEGKTVIVSGSGNVAQYCAEKVTALGGKVVAMSDSQGYIYDPNGINLRVLFDIKQRRRARISVYAQEVPGSEYHEGCKDIWTVPCDIAMPCASQNEMDVEGAKAVIANGAMAVFEGANMPLTPEAISAVIEAGLLYTPGKASNAGGVATSGLEMSQNSLRMSWSFEEVDEKLHGIMKSIFKACYDASVECGQPGNMMLGANVAGFLKVADAMMAQGIV